MKGHGSFVSRWARADSFLPLEDNSNRCTPRLEFKTFKILINKLIDYKLWLGVQACKLRLSLRKCIPRIPIRITIAHTLRGNQLPSKFGWVDVTILVLLRHGKGGSVGGAVPAGRLRGEGSIQAYWGRGH